MEIPWITKGTAEGPVVVMASKFELRSAWRSPMFLFHSLRLWRQALRSPGVLGVSLRAQPLRGTFWTLSAWTSKKELYAYAQAGPHRPAMRRIRPWMRDATFRFWDLDTVPEPAALWAEGERRLAALDGE